MREQAEAVGRRPGFGTFGFLETRWNIVGLGIAGTILAVILGVAIAVGAMSDIVGYVSKDGIISTGNLPMYIGRTLGRMTAAYFLSLGFAIVYGIATAMTRRASHVLLPLLDILQSVPVVGFIPVVFLFFISRFGSGTGGEVSSIILIFTAMV